MTIKSCRIVTNEEWEEFTKNNIEKAAKEINSARQLRAYTDIIIKQAIDDLWNQYNAVNSAFKRRISEIREAKTKMEVQHSEVRFSLTISFGSKMRVLDCPASQ